MSKNGPQLDKKYFFRKLRGGMNLYNFSWGRLKTDLISSECIYTLFQSHFRLKNNSNFSPNLERTDDKQFDPFRLVFVANRRTNEVQIPSNACGYGQNIDSGRNSTTQYGHMCIGNFELFSMCFIWKFSQFPNVKLLCSVIL